MSCPQTEQDFMKYFTDLIGHEFDTSANDFEAVMAKPYLWNGQMMQIPANVPLAGEQLPPDAPFYGLTQQVKGGVSAGRIWIPSSTPQTDENGNEWFTRYIQIIKDKPGGQHGTDFLWTWWYQGGNEYVPICEGDVVPPTNGGDIDIPQRVETLESQVANHESRISQLEKVILKMPEVIALIADNGEYVTAEVDTEGHPLVTRGKKADAWQQFKFIIVK